MQCNLSGIIWHKSSYSSANGQCVEVARGVAGIAPIRDSKTPAGPHLIFPTATWTAFVQTLKNGDLPTV